MKTFKQFLKEMPALIHHVPKPEHRDESDLNHTIKKSNFRMMNNEKISKFDDKHDSYHSRPPGNDYHSRSSGAYLVVERKTKRIKATISGKHQFGDFRIDWAAKHSSSQFNMTDVYHHLVMNHTPLVSSVEHSPGSYKNWKKLSERPGVHVSVQINGEGASASLGDDWHKNYDNRASGERIHRLVARKKYD